MRQGIIGSIILIVFVALLAVPIGVAAAIYLQEYARDTRANRLLITNIRNLAGVPAIVYGILGVVIFVQAMQSITGPKVHGRSIIAGGLTLVGAGDAVRHHHHDGGAARRADGHPGRRVRCGGDAMGGRAEPRAAVRRAGCVHRGHPGDRPSVRRDRSSAARGSGDGVPGDRNQSFLETLQGKYTALPTIIYSWSRLPSNLWGANTSAAIVVLLGSILVVNFLAIILRNRYERKW